MCDNLVLDIFKNDTIGYTSEVDVWKSGDANKQQCKQL